MGHPPIDHMIKPDTRWLARRYPWFGLQRK